MCRLGYVRKKLAFDVKKYSKQLYLVTKQSN